MASGEISYDLEFDFNLLFSNSFVAEKRHQPGFATTFIVLGSRSTLPTP